MDLHHLATDEDASSPGGPPAAGRDDALLAAVLALGANQKGLAAQVNALAARGSDNGSNSSGGGRPRGNRAGYIEGLATGVADARRASGACMKCGQTGHFKGECRNNVKPNL